VFEDLHWADEAMLDFLDHLAEHSRGVSMLVIGTTRPELLERHPVWARAIRGASVRLAPLAGSDTARLIAALFGAASVSARD
jgi:predicted ATPase